jgi:hypothetical protein
MAGSFGATRPGEDPVRPYRVLDTAKRRRASIVYVAMAIGTAALVLKIGLSPLWITAVLPLALLALYQFLGGWKMQVTDMEAIQTAAEEVSFGVGHGSATLGYRGLRARPIWEILVFGDGTAPRFQALVTIDAVSGEVTGTYEEPVEQI